MLEFSHITHAYEQSRATVETLEDVSFTCNEGEFISILGPSGCGKSTLLNMAAGFISPQTGSIKLNGKSITSPGKNRAMVFQDSALLPWLSVRENIALALTGKPAEYKQERIAQVLETVGLRGFNEAMPHQLSIGMRQKASIARALAMGSDILLMDEPFASLDEQTRLRLNRELVDIWRQEHKSILFVTHSITEALVMSTRIILLSSRPACIIGDWKLKNTHTSGTQQQYDRLHDPEIQKLSDHILTKLELCCPPGQQPCACKEHSK
jgi:NitT/TauT family transport system ATP-binding protein